MTTFKQKLSRATLIFYTVLSIASTLYLIFRPEDDILQQQYFDTQLEIDRIQQILEEQDSIYGETIFSLQQENDSLHGILKVNEVKLSQARIQSNVLSADLQQYLERYERDSSLTKDQVAFDSLSDLSQEYLIESSVRDSLCDKHLMTMEELMQVKNAIIISEQALIEDYKSSNEQLLQTANALNDERNHSIKLLERKARLCRVLSGVLVASVGTTILLIAD